MGNCEPPRRERLGETPPNWLSFGCVSPTRWWHTASPPPHCACVRSLRSRPCGLVWGYWDSTSLRLWNTIPTFYINKLINTKIFQPFQPFILAHHTSYLPHHTSHHHTSNLIPPTSNIIPPTSYIKPSTSYIKPHTSRFRHHTSYIFNTTPALMHTLLLSSYFPLTKCIIFSTPFSKRLPLFYWTLITRIARIENSLKKNCADDYILKKTVQSAQSVVNIFSCHSREIPSSNSRNSCNSCSKTLTFNR